MKKERKKSKTEKINNINIFKESNNKSEDCLSTIDNLINRMKKSSMKLTRFRIYSLFKDNKYKEIKIEKIFSQLINEYDNNQNSFTNYKNKYFDSKEKLIKSIKCCLKNGSFEIIKRNNSEYAKLNPQKTLDFLTSLNNKNMKEQSTTNSEKKKQSVKKSNFSYSNKREIKNKFIGKKRRRKLTIKNKRKIGPHINIKNNNIKMNQQTINNNNDNSKIKNIEQVPSNELYFQGCLMSKNLTSLTFNCSENYKSNPISDSINYNYFEQIKMPTPCQTELLFDSKNEEQIYELLKKEIEPINSKISQINNNLIETQKKLLNIENSLKLMDQSYEDYIQIKSKFKKNCTTFSQCSKTIEFIIKTLALFENYEFIPDRTDSIQKEIDHFKKCLELGENIIEKNDNKICKLNDLDFSFHTSKIFVIKGVKDIIGNNDDYIMIEYIKKIIKPELITFFNNINSNNESNHDFKILYEENQRLKNTYQLYKEKEEHFIKVLINKD